MKLLLEYGYILFIDVAIIVYKQFIFKRNLRSVRLKTAAEKADGKRSEKFRLPFHDNFQPEPN